MHNGIYSFSILRHAKKAYCRNKLDSTKNDIKKCKVSNNLVNKNSFNKIQSDFIGNKKKHYCS